MRGLSLRTKVFLLFAGAALLTVVPVLLFIGQAVEERVYEQARGELERSTAAVSANWEATVFRLRETARRMALERDVERAMRDGDQSALRGALTRETDSGQVAFAVDSTGRTLVGPVLDSSVVNSGGTVVFVPSDATPPMRVAVWPVFAESAQPAAPADTLPAGRDSVRIGVVGIGERLDQPAIELLKRAAGTDVALVAGDPAALVASTLPDTLSAFLEGVDLATMPLGVIRLQPAEGLLYVPINVPTTGSPAVVVLLRPVAEELSLVRGIEQSVFGIGLVALALALGLALLVARIVARPAQALAAAAAHLARGDFSAPLPRASGDEIGQLTRAFRDMRSAIAERETRLRSAQAEMIRREKLAAMGRLVAQLSHEINNPIYNIQNCLEVLDRRIDAGDPNREFLALAQEELQRMAVLTRQMLDQSRPLEDAAGPVEVNQLARRVVGLAARDLETRRIQAELRLEPGIPLVVAHPDALQQVLANLVTNAIDAMPSGGLLRVTTRADAAAVEVEVEDTGVGITEEHLPHIFEAFYTTKPGVRGIGLGLFVSEGIIRGHRGRLLVESRVGEGSRFTVQLPRETLDAALAAPDPSEAPEPAAGASHR